MTTDGETLFMFILAMGMLAFFLGGVVEKREMNKLIVEKGYGLFCPDTGDFAFKDECGKETE